VAATTLMITERRAYGIVADLTRAGYLVKARDGRLVDAARGVLTLAGSAGRRSAGRVARAFPYPESGTNRGRLRGQVLLIRGLSRSGTGSGVKRWLDQGQAFDQGNQVGRGLGDSRGPSGAWVPTRARPCC